MNAQADYREAMIARTKKIRAEQARRNRLQEIENAKPGGCHRNSFRCPTARNMRQRTAPCCRRWILDILSNIGALLDEIGATWWVDYGTLLGAVRHGGLIPWDKDTDLGILAEDRDALLAQFPRIIKELDYFPTYKPPHDGDRFKTGDRVKVRLSRRNHTNTDIFVWHERPGGMLERLHYIGADLYKGREFPKRLLLPLQRVEFDGVEVNVPARAEELAEWRYGPGWPFPEYTKHPKDVRRGWKEEHGG